MDDEQQLIEHAAQLHRLIGQDPPASCADTLKLIKKDPRMLAAGITMPRIKASDGTKFYPTPLNYAIVRNNLPAADAILTILNDEKHAKTIRDYARKDLHKDSTSDDYKLFENLYKHRYPFDKVLYSNHVSCLPHAGVHNTEMLELLHRHHYDLHLKTAGAKNPLLTSLQDHVVDNFKTDNFDIDKMPVSYFRRFIELAVDQNVKSIGMAEVLPRDRYRTPNFAHHLFITLATLNSPIATLNPSGEDVDTKWDKILQKWALAGLDFRFMGMGEYLNNPACKNKTYKEICALTHIKLSKFCADQASDYYNSPNLDGARAACAAGHFPYLLRRCVEKDKARRVPKDVPQLISYLDDYWRGEYSQLIRVAEASTTRTASTKPEASSLGMYARNADIPVGVPRA